MGQCSSKDEKKYEVQTMSRQLIALNKNDQRVYDMIKNIASISALPESIKRDVARKVKSEFFKAGEVIMKQGESGNKFYLIASGVCHVYMDGTQVSTLRDGDYMGEQALLKPILRTATIKANTDTRCFTMDNDTFQAMARATNLAFVNRVADGRAERKALSRDDSEDYDETEQFAKPVMSDEVLTWLCSCVKHNLLFKGRGRETTSSILQAMTLRTVNAETEIIKQDDATNCDEFYILESGECAVVKDGRTVERIGRGAPFGELALVYSNPRTATIRALTPCRLWVLTRRDFKARQKRARKEMDSTKVDALSHIPLLATLTRADLSQLADTLKQESFPCGHVFFRQGDAATNFYLITEGSVCGTANNKQFELAAGEFFGELALRTDRPRSATIMASSAVECFVADRHAFDSLFGGFDNAMERQVEEYQRPSQSEKSYRTDFLMKRSLDDFESGPVVGRGKYGLVKFVRDPHTSTVYALKAVAKAWVRSRSGKQSSKRVATLFNERNVMRRLNDSEFIVKLRGTFKDARSVYFLMEAATGGDLFNILKQRGYLDEKTARFFVASMIEAVAHMHSHNIIHRDLKPENIVINSKGYPLLTDFGFAKQLDERNGNKTYTLCGTPGYIAPEIILGHGYGKGSDWFAVGCVMFDMLTGQPPFPTRADQFAMIEQMMANQLALPMYLSFWAKDLLRNLIQIDTMKRFGITHGGVDRIKHHQWFKDAQFSWDSFAEQSMAPPIVPQHKVTDKMSAENFDSTDIDEMSKMLDSKHTNEPLPKHLVNWDIDF